MFPFLKTETNCLNIEHKDIYATAFLFESTEQKGVMISTQNNVEMFLENFGQVIDNTTQHLEKNRYCAVVIGDKYANSEIVPLGFHCMNLFLQRGFKMKAILVRNFEDTKGKSNQKAIWRYRALASDFYIFKHEYIFVFKKVK